MYSLAMSRIKKKILKAQHLGDPRYLGKDELSRSEENLESYNSDLVARFHTKLEIRESGQDERILEFGAGSGTLAQIFRSTFGISPECVELDSELLQVLIEKGFRSFRSLPESNGGYSGMYTSNVLEHIPDDVSTLNEMFAAMKKDAKLVVYVPAFPILFSQMDYEVGHVRRYKRNELEEKISSAGFIVVAAEYSDSIGFFATLLVKLLGYQSKIGNLGNARSLRFYDQYLYPISRFFDKAGLKHIVGKNLFIEARKP